MGLDTIILPYIEFNLIHLKIKMGLEINYVHVQLGESHVMLGKQNKCQAAFC